MTDPDNYAVATATDMRSLWQRRFKSRLGYCRCFVSGVRLCRLRRLPIRLPASRAVTSCARWTPSGRAPVLPRCRRLDRRPSASRVAAAMPTAVAGCDAVRTAADGPARARHTPSTVSCWIIDAPLVPAAICRFINWSITEQPYALAGLACRWWLFFCVEADQARNYLCQDLLLNVHFCLSLFIDSHLFHRREYIFYICLLFFADLFGYSHLPRWR